MSHIKSPRNYVHQTYNYSYPSENIKSQANHTTNDPSQVSRSASQQKKQLYQSEGLRSPRPVSKGSQFDKSQSQRSHFPLDGLSVPEKAMDPKIYQDNSYGSRSQEVFKNSVNQGDSYQKYKYINPSGTENVNETNLSSRSYAHKNDGMEYNNHENYGEIFDDRVSKNGNRIERPNGIFSKVTKQTPQKYLNWMLHPSENKLSYEEEIELLKFERFQTTIQLLVEHTLERPLFYVPRSATEIFGFPPDAFTLSTITKLFQVSCQIIVIAITAESIQKKDTAVPIQVFSYLLSQAAINLLISLFFLLRIFRVNYRGSIFYSAISAILTFVAFGLVLGFLMTSECTTNDLQVCHFRRATTGMVSLSTFIWLIEMVIFFTIILVASLEDVLPIPVLEEMKKRPFIVDDKSFANYDNTQYDSDEETIKDEPKQNFMIKKYIITENGMEPIASENDLKNKVRVELYVDPPKNNLTTDHTGTTQDALDETPVKLPDPAEKISQYKSRSSKTQKFVY